MAVRAGDDAPGGRRSRPADPARALLEAEVAELETLPRFDRDGASVRADAALAAARAAGLTELERRAQLVQAEVLQRRGRLSDAGRLAQQVLKWATEQGSTHLLARGHYVLQAVFLDLGDLSLALEHSVRAVELLPESAPGPLRFDHLCRLADCLGLNGDLAAARERYPAALRLAERLGDVDRQLVVVNNWAYVEAQHGDAEAALALSTQLQELSAAAGRSLHVGRLDTVARTLMRLGRLEEAEQVLQPGLDPTLQRASSDGDAGADCLLTLAEVQRRLGRLGQAQETLAACVRICEELGLGTIRVHARQEQAELHAATGDFRSAYEEHKAYAREAMQLQSDERDARARTLQAVYEATEARRQSRRYRELSLRDPLTGLYNRRFVDEELPRLLAASAGGRATATVALLDLDHFKRVNDTCSHDVGDEVLRAVARLVDDASAAGPEGSFAARMGGEEFLLVLGDGDRETTTGRLDALRRAIAAHPWTELTGALPVTASIGAASGPAWQQPDAAQLLGRADACLYRAKRTGRDRVVTDLV
ncbi:diguanylate cyclase [Modestobacter sp. NPDC049651]|uniref:tetratricopeptide repeat-containing diguanylate cyclase n=1 Tax=unclassified Modestobacter TaxID=2643866 RepID=UPI0033F82BFC